MLRLLIAPRPPLTLMLIGLAIGVVFAALLFPLSFVTGDHAFWTNPKGAIPGSDNDVAQVLVSYFYFAQAPLQAPLFYVENLAPPAGTNILFTDAVPIAALLGWLVSVLAGHVVNPYGLWAFACFALPAPLMVWAIYGANQRNLLGASAASILVSFTPALLYRWGHLALSAHFLIIGALALYTNQLKAQDGHVLGWLACLVLALLTNAYVFAMCFGLYLAAGVDVSIATGRSGTFLRSLGVILISVGAVALAAGYVDPRNPASAGEGYGAFSNNPASFIVPQFSGLFGRNYTIGGHGQYEGFSYLGAGVMFALLMAAPYWLRNIRVILSAHPALVLATIGFLAFAISNKPMVGNIALYEASGSRVPATDSQSAASSSAGPMGIAVQLAKRVTGTFRSSGRFAWPVIYLLVFASIVGVLNYWGALIALITLIAACLLQVIDVGPLRQRVVASIAKPTPLPIDGQKWRSAVAAADRVFIWPTYTCLRSRDGETVAMAVQLLAARENRPVNSVYTARSNVDCVAEGDGERSSARNPLDLHVHISDPNAAYSVQLGEGLCGELRAVTYCGVQDRPRTAPAGKLQ